MFDWNILWQAGLVGFGRNVVGVWKNAIAIESDMGETISSYEWQILAKAVGITIGTAVIIAGGSALAGWNDPLWIDLTAGVIVAEIFRAFDKRKSSVKKKKK